MYPRPHRHSRLALKCGAVLALFITAVRLLSAYSAESRLQPRHNSARLVGQGLRALGGGPPRQLVSHLPTYDGSKTRCDVLVIGGTPSGIAAALAAARRGADVVLIESRPLLGGDVVYAMLNQFDVPARPGEASPVHGIFAEFYDQLGTAFSIEKADHLFEDTVAIEPTLHVYTRTQVVRVIKEGDTVVGAVLKGGAPKAGAGAQAAMQAGITIDATNDAGIAARAGVGYYVGRENANPDKAMQSVSLLFSLSGVDWHGLKKYVQGRRVMQRPPTQATELGLASRTAIAMPRSRLARGVHALGLGAPQRRRAPLGIRQPRLALATATATRTTSANTTTPLINGQATTRQAPRRARRVMLRLGGIHGGYIWERGDLVHNYRPRAHNIMFLSINFGRQDDGSVVLNTLNVIGVNGLDPNALRLARRQAIAELPFFISYLRGTIPALRNARLRKVAPELYVRETRHVHGYYALKVADVRAQRRFDDRIAMASYPLDLHPYKMGQTNPFGARRYFYTIPLRCLIPRQIDGLLVASRSFSATYSAAGSARVIPITMSQGEAAGAAAWLCTRRALLPHALLHDPAAVADLQASLKEWGADIGDSYPRSSHPPLRVAAGNVQRHLRRSAQGAARGSLHSPIPQ